MSGLDRNCATNCAFFRIDAFDSAALPENGLQIQMHRPPPRTHEPTPLDNHIVLHVSTWHKVSKASQRSARGVQGATQMMTDVDQAVPTQS